MPYILTGTDDNVQAYPHERIEGITLSVIKPVTPPSTDAEADDTDDSDDSGTYTAIVQLSIKGAAGTIKPYNETGDASVVEPAKTLYREIMDGFINGKTVNLSEFELTEPKKVSAKKTTPAKKTAPEAPAEQPSE